MELVLQRNPSSEKCTIGTLTINGIYQCLTLEDVVRHDGAKVYGETAISAGVYEVALTWSPRFKRVLPLVVNVSGFSGIRIHPGNTAQDTEGCLLVGRTLGEDAIYESRAAFNDLFAILTLANSRGETITIDIRDA